MIKLPVFCRPFLCLIALVSSLRAEPITVPAGETLLPPGIGDFHAYSSQAIDETMKIEPVTAKAQPFTDALRITARRSSPNYWEMGVTARTTGPIHKGDVLWISLYSRCIESTRETGEALAELVLMQFDNKVEVRPLQRGLSFGKEWTRTYLPFVAEVDSAPGEARVGIRFGYTAQTFEVGEVTLINCGPKADLAKLPKTVLRYEGWAPDAAWRKAAAERIEKIRKGDFAIRVVDSFGQPVADADVAVRMKRHAFAWGAQMEGRQIWNENDPVTAHFREIIENYFNKSVFGNDLKWGRWLKLGDLWGRDNALAALPWFEEHHIPLRGHVLVWPSWRNLPKTIFTDELKKDPAAMQKAVLDHIDEETGVFKDRLAEWDVINEIYAHHDLLDVLGRGAMIDWFKHARAGTPKSKLFFNDYVMFQGTGPGSPSQFFYDSVKFLKDGGAPIDAIGEQAHFGGSPPGPPQLIATLDHFAELGLPIQFSEFDIDTADVEMQADFMRDFVTVAFSHPAVVGVVQWAPWETDRGPEYSPLAALWDKDWNLRPHGKVFLDLITKTWWTNTDGKTAADGNYSTRGFYGDYEITVTRGGKRLTVKTTLSPRNAGLIIILP